MIELDAISLISILTAVTLVFQAALGWADGRSPLLSRLFAAVALLAAWWTAGMAVVFTNLPQLSPRFFQSSQILSGFFGPVLFLFTLAYTGRLRSWRPKWLLVLIPGAAGTTSYFLIAFLVPGPMMREAADLFLSGVPLSEIPIVSAFPWLLPLQRFHAIQLLVFLVGSLAVFVIDMRKAANRFEAWFLTIVCAAGILGLVLANLLPLAGGARSSGMRLAPLVAFPFVTMVYYFMRQRIDALHRLAEERQVLMTYLPVEAADRLLDEKAGPVVSDGDAAVLFSDLRDFTTLCERSSPEDVLRWFDRFFRVMGDTILQEKGMIERIVGDGILAIFGAPVAIENPCQAAYRAAHRMQRRLDELNRTDPLVPGHTVRMGVGLHYGPVVTGSVGGAARKAYTVFGDVVNTSQRIESLTKSTGHSILVSRIFREHLDAAVRDAGMFAGNFELKGKSEELSLYGYDPMNPPITESRDQDSLGGMAKPS